ncbi:hypothetical protein KEM55_002433 [Ascosphaera atra]|nr:hypothetical protein KEM55_002433 [Ascosphaera atra]
MPPKTVPRLWSPAEEDVLMAWMEKHKMLIQHSNRHRLCIQIKEEAFPFVDNLDWSHIRDKIGNLNRQRHAVKKELKSTGYGARPEQGESTVQDAANKKCRFFSRLEALFGEETKDDEAATQKLPLMPGDSLSGVLVLPREEGVSEAGDSEDYTVMTELAGAATQSGSATTTQGTLPVEGMPTVHLDFASTPTAASQVEAVPETQVGPAEAPAGDSTSEQPKKRRKTAKPELDNLIRISWERSEVIKAARVDAAKIKADAQREESQEATRRHEATLDLMRMYLQSQNELIARLLERRE